MHMSEAQIAARWKKGQSGNPKGRPKKPKCLEESPKTLTHTINTLLEQPCYRFGSDKPITRMDRLAEDIVARAELGEKFALSIVFNIRDRSDRRRVQALRAAVRTKIPKVRRFERHVADGISRAIPPLGPDKKGWILPARETRTEHVKPKPVERIKDYLPNGDINPVALEISRRANMERPLTEEERELRFGPPPVDVPDAAMEHKAVARDAPVQARMTSEVPASRDDDPFAHLPKHLSKEERAERDRNALADLYRRRDELRAAKAASATAETPAKSVPEAVQITVPKTIAITVPSGVLPPRQTVDASCKSRLLNSACDFSNLFASHDDDVSHLNGATMNGKHVNGHNGSHMNGKRMNGSHVNGAT